MGRNDSTILGIILIIVGALMLFGRLAIPYLAEIAALLVLIYGILILIGKRPGGTLFGIICVVAGVLVLIGGVLAGTIGGILNLIVAIGLIVAGALRLFGK